MSVINELNPENLKTKEYKNLTNENVDEGNKSGDLYHFYNHMPSCIF